MKGRLNHLVMGSLFSLALVLGTSVFSYWPEWQSLGANDALLRLSLTQSGVRNCRARTEEELAALPTNMRRAEVCESRRAPVYVELDLNGETIFAENLPPSGLSGTGPSRIYKRFELPAGSYDITVRLRDDPAMSEFTNVASRHVTLKPAQSMVIDYNDEADGFVFD